MRSLPLVALFAMIACGDGPSTPSPIGSGTGPAFSAVIDGADWTGTSLDPLLMNGFFSVGAENASNTINFGIGAPAQPGTYAVGPGSSVFATLVLTPSGQAWQAGSAFGSGTVTVATASPTTVSGTFSFTLVPTPGTGSVGNKTAVAGSFRLTF